MPDEKDGGESTAQPIRIKLDALQLFYGMVRHYAREIRGAEYESLPDDAIVFEDIEGPTRLKPKDVWPCFGEEISIEEGGRRYLVWVPPFVDIHGDFIGRFFSESSGFVKRYGDFLGRMFVHLPDPRSATARVDVLKMYHQFSPSEQEEGIGMVRENFARAMLGNSFAEQCIEILEPFVNKYPSHPQIVHWREQLKAASELHERFPQIEEIFSAFFDRYYSGLPGQGGPSIIQFLPHPPRQKKIGEGLDEVAAVEPPAIEPAAVRPPMELEEDAVRAIPIAEAGRRLAVYQTLGPVRVIRPKKVFGKEEHNYFGYAVRMWDILRKVSIWRIYVDCDRFGSAAYIFDVDPDDPFRWIYDVQKPKQELRRIEAQRHQPNPPEDEAPTYVGREVHDKTFEQRIKRRHDQD